MRRRSERKKSTDSPVTPPASRRTRSKKSSSQSEAEKSVDTTESQTEKDNVESDENEEQRSIHKRRNTPKRTGERSTATRRRNQRAPSPDLTIKAIPEEENENGIVGTSDETDVKEDAAPTESHSLDNKSMKECNDVVVETETAPISNENATSVSPFNTHTKLEVDLKASDVLVIRTEEQEQEKDIKEDTVKSPVQSVFANIKENSNASSVEEKPHVNSVAVDDPKDTKTTQQTDGPFNKKDRVTQLNDSTTKENETSNNITSSTIDNTRVRKRKWLTHKISENKAPILAISSDSLKNIISDVHPVPLSDVQLESSSDVEEIISEREEGEETPSPERQQRKRVSADSTEKTTTKRNLSDIISAVPPLTPVQRSPSPPSNDASSILFITNLVRPFTILQLKGLLARTGTIVEDGFWIDRIKSKCYVRYSTADQAIETRHALHGVRWPISNPKCLNVDFGSEEDMGRAIQSTKDETPKFGHDNNKDNLIIGTGWNRERIEIDEKKNIRPVREWDVGKKENLERERHREHEKRRSKEREVSRGREMEKDTRDRKQRSRPRDPRSSISPVRKVKKKESDPPLRLLDDLFRKTKSTPCIYWLPLTPEQISEKEAIRQKRIQEHKERMRQRELERVKEREKDRNRPNDRDRDREHRRNRSSDRRRSRSRDRRRY